MRTTSSRRGLVLLLGVAATLVLVGLAIVVTGPVGGQSVATVASGELHGPGAPVFDGLVVPPGALLLAHPRPGTSGDRVGSGTVASFQIVGDPLALWADLVRQVHALGGTLPSSSACFWNPSDGPNPGPLSSPRPPGRMTVECVAGTSFPRAGENIELSLDLWLTPDGAELSLGSTHGGAPTGPVPAEDPGPVTRADLRGLPTDPTPPAPGVGDPFGEENDCFERGYQRFRVPPGAQFLGGGRTPATNPVLAVDDPEAALKALQRQLDDPNDQSGTYSVSHTVVGTETVWTLHGSVEAGGGSCEIYSIDDGRAIVITTHSD